jgi:serine/threonine-protein kinase RsbW
VTVSDEVHLALPAAPGYVRLARLTAAGLASRLGFTFDEVEDLRIAVDELCFLLVGPEGHPGTVELTYRIEPDALVVEGRGSVIGAVDEPTAFSAQILAAIVDSYEVRQEEGTVCFRLCHNGRAE